MVRRLIEARGCRLLFLPASSPDCAPIAHTFGTVKETLRRAGARTKEALEAASAAALDTVTARDTCGEFHHCGYTPPGQLLCEPLYVAGVRARLAMRGSGHF